MRNDDIDLAISVLIHSVINSQKFAVKRVMERKFSKYLVSVQDTDQLLEFQLRKLFAEASRLHDAVSSGSSELPASVGGAKALVSFNLNNNQLEELPAELARLPLEARPAAACHPPPLTRRLCWPQPPAASSQMPP